MVELKIQNLTVTEDMDLTDGKEIYYETTDDYEKLQNLPELDGRTIRRLPTSARLLQPISTVRPILHRERCR